MSYFSLIYYFLKSRLAYLKFNISYGVTKIVKILLTSVINEKTEAHGINLGIMKSEMKSETCRKATKEGYIV